MAAPDRSLVVRLAVRALVLMGCCVGLTAAFWLLSGQGAHAATQDRAAGPSGGLAGAVTGTVSGAVAGTVNGVTSAVTGTVNGPSVFRAYCGKSTPNRESAPMARK
jgi:hypothetical protein